MVKKLLVMVQVLGFVLAAVSGMADSPNGTIDIELNSLSAIDNMGVSWVDGVLTFRGKTHLFKIKGLKTTVAGVRALTAQGEVFNLRSASDLAGKYQKANPAGITSMAGQKGLVIRNDQGVVISIRVIKKRLLGKMRTIGEVLKREGVSLDLMPEGLTIQLVQ
ncbi:MAG: hypothetical protein P8X65_05355 [Syntrophobacterales bacterium]|jgi:hypothetical protein